MSKVLEKHLKNIVILRRTAHSTMPKTYRYPLFDKRTCLTLCQLLHISQKIYLEDVTVEPYDWIHFLTPEMVTNAGNKAIQLHPEAFEGKLLGANYMADRVTLSADLGYKLLEAFDKFHTSQYSRGIYIRRTALEAMLPFLNQELQQVYGPTARIPSILYLIKN